MTRALPAVSVIVPTRNAPPTLGRTLANLANQTLPPHRYEVIVVTGEDVADAWQHAPVERQYDLRVYSQPGPGAARRRNAGAAHARGELLVFLDDDMAAEPGLLEAHVAAHVDAHVDAQHGAQGDGGGMRVVMGYLPPRLTLTGRDRRAARVALDQRDWWEDTFREMARPGHRFRYTDLLSGNFSLARALFARVGGFDVDLSCREDYELGARLLRAGAVFVLNLAARADHQDATDLARSLARKAAEGRADVQVARLHPQLGSTMTFAIAGEYMSPASHWLLAVAARNPALANFVVRLLILALGLLARLGLHAFWTRVNGGLLLHYYWRGVLSEARGWPEVHALAGVAEPIGDVSIDLAQGLEPAQRELERLRPQGVRFTWYGLPLGRLPAQAGAEPVRGCHMVAWLAGEGAYCCAKAQALFAALDGDEQALQLVAASALAAQRPDLCGQGAGGEGWEALLADRLQGARTGEVDLANGWPALQPLVGSTDRCEVLLRAHGQPLGWLHLKAQDHPRALGEVVYDLLAQADLRRLLEPPVAAVPAAPEVSDCRALTVIVCTRNRPENLAGCLEALRRQTCAPREIIVVDNAPADARTQRLAAAAGVRYVREDRPGLDFARNCGLLATTTPFLAYVDDDARAAPDWVATLAAAFATHPVAAVTGNVAPAELATREQGLFEWVYGGMRHGFEQWLFRRDLVSTTELLWANLCGVGTNMAFRRQVLVDLGGFDPALDVGGPAGGGGDLELFHRLVASGHSLLYEPAAVVWHIHRRDEAGLRRQLFDNGRAFGAYLLTCAANHTVAGGQVVSFALRNWLYWALLRRLLHPGAMPRSLVLAELQGALISPWAYWRAVRRIKTMEL